MADAQHVIFGGRGTPRESMMVLFGRVMVCSHRLLYLAPFGRNLRCKFWLGVVSPSFGMGVVTEVGDGSP